MHGDYRYGSEAGADMYGANTWFIIVTSFYLGKSSAGQACLHAYLLHSYISTATAWGMRRQGLSVLRTSHDMRPVGTPHGRPEYVGRESTRGRYASPLRGGDAGGGATAAVLP